MKLIFLDSATLDYQWFVSYYKETFPAGRKKAFEKLTATLNLIKDNPYIGHKTEEKYVREFSIPNIPFSLIYHITDETIEILRIWDERQNR